MSEILLAAVDAIGLLYILGDILYEISEETLLEYGFKKYYSELAGANVKLRNKMMPPKMGIVIVQTDRTKVFGLTPTLSKFSKADYFGPMIVF